MKRFLRRTLKLVWLALIILPLVLFGMWYGGGQQVLTKPLRAVEVQTQDDLFGDSVEETVWVRGPILGYFIGLDAVGVGSAISFMLLTFAAGRRLRRRRLQQPANGSAKEPA